MNNEILDDQLQNSLGRRRALLPVWIKVFVWIFLILGAIVPFVFLLGVFGGTAELSLYGLETNQPFSLVGIVITLLFLIKGVVAFGLWTEKTWAVKLAILDGFIGIILCAYLMFIQPFLLADGGMDIDLRLELIPLVFYILKMKEIRSEWEMLNP